MSDDERRLLDAILESPDDDAPRLVYADWLQSRGDPRGELIQLQCQLASAPDDDRRRAIRITENKLLKEHGDGWTKPLFKRLPLPREFVKYEFEFVRGFIEHATITLDTVSKLDTLLEVAPLIRSLRITGNGGIATPIQKPELDGALTNPSFRRLRTLELTLGGAGNLLAHEVADADTLTNLRTLKIGASVWGEQAQWFGRPAEELVLDDAGAIALAASPHLANVEHLDLDSNRIGIRGVHAIARGAWKLRTLVLSHNAIDAGAEIVGLAAAPTARTDKNSRLAAALAGPALQTLEVLGLTAIPFAPEDIGELAACPTLANLRELDLERCHLGVPGITAMCKTFALPALRRLRLERNNLCDAGALAIAGCAALANLTSFEAGHNRIGQKGGTALATTPYFKNLERLTLNEPRWKPEMTAVFASSPTLANAKIYLGGRLVGRKNTKPSVETAPANAAGRRKAKSATALVAVDEPSKPAHDKAKAKTKPATKTRTRTNK